MKIVHASLGIADALVSSVLGRELDSTVYYELIKALEILSGQIFIDESPIGKEASQKLFDYLHENRDLASEPVLHWSESR